LTHLSEYYQIFIDNLNGNKDIKFNEIIKKNNSIDLLNTCINANEQLKSNIFKSISYMKYNIISEYKGINKENYINKLIDFIINNSKHINEMNQVIIRQIFKDNEDIISILFNKEKIIKENDVDILSVIQKYLSSLYISKLNIFFFKAENDHYFSSLLTNQIDESKNVEIKDENNNKKLVLIEKVKQLYLDNLTLNDDKIRIVEKPRANKLDIMLGLKLPGLKPIFNRLVKYIRDNIIKKYLNNENNLRNYFEPGEINNEIDKYMNEINRFINYSINYINNEPLLLKIVKCINELYIISS